MPRSLGLICAAFLCWVALGGTAGAASLSGTWIVGEGPFAGTTLYGADPAGKVKNSGANDDSGAHGHIREPNAACGDLHFEGFIKKKRIKDEDCVRVASENYVQPFLRSMAFAINYENGSFDRHFLRYAVQHLHAAYDELQKARGAGTIGDTGFDNLEGDMFKVLKLDKKARRQLGDDEVDKDNDGVDDTAEKLVEKALKLKFDIVRYAPPEMKYLQAPHVTQLVAEFQPANFQTVYTENVVKNPDGRPLTFTWSLVELNDPGCVNFQPNLPLINQAIWHHPDSQCNHALEGSNGHQGIVGVIVNDGKFTCTAIYTGSNTGTSNSFPVCSQVSLN